MKRIMLLLLACFVTTSLFFCCNPLSDNDVKTEKVEYVTLTVAPNTVLVYPFQHDGNPTDYLLVVENGKTRHLPLGWIDGFNYEKGYEYKLKVKKITPIHDIQDAPRSFYYLIEILSKNKEE
jgi:hypothetical protein